MILPLFRWTVPSFWLCALYCENENVLTSHMSLLTYWSQHNRWSLFFYHFLLWLLSYRMITPTVIIVPFHLLKYARLLEKRVKWKQLSKIVLIFFVRKNDFLYDQNKALLVFPYTSFLWIVSICHCTWWKKELCIYILSTVQSKFWKWLLKPYPVKNRIRSSRNKSCTSPLLLPTLH